MTTVQNTIGAIFAGALFACALSGVLAVQVFLYHRRYPNDHKLYKIMVWCFWVIDTIQTTSLAVGAWNYAIQHFGDASILMDIFTSLSIATTCGACTLACVNILQGVRIYELNNRTWWTLTPHIFFSIARFGVSTSIIVELYVKRSLLAFGEHLTPLLDTSFLLSAVADVYIACVLCYYLVHSRRNVPTSTKRMLDSLIMITINNGLLTSIFSLATLITWMSMQDNLIFIALHWMTGKCFSNSQLATLNMRKWIHARTISGTVVSDPNSSLQAHFAGRAVPPSMNHAVSGATGTVGQSPMKEAYTDGMRTPITLNREMRLSRPVSFQLDSLPRQPEEA